MVVLCFVGANLKAKFPGDRACVLEAENPEESQPPSPSASDSEAEEDEGIEVEEEAAEDKAPQKETETSGDKKNLPSAVRPLIVLMDSLGGSKSHIFSTLPAYLCLEYEAIYKRKVTVENLGLVKTVARVPRQNNGCDCGVFVTHFVERFVQDSHKPEFMEKLVCCPP